MPLRPATGAHALDLDGPAADLNWREAVDLAVEHLARTGRAFTVDDVRGLGVGEPLRPNSWGAVVSAASKHGVIEPLAVGTSSRRERHSGLRRVWIGTPAWRDADQGREAS